MINVVRDVYNNEDGRHLTQDEFLRMLGDRVRGLRANRGMTRRMLSRDSDVSERYLANLEQGKGNISINLLRQVARALNTDPADLLMSATRQSPEYSLISDFVRRLSRDEQQSALQLLYGQFSGRLAGNRRVALIGLRGAGKTTLGKLLEERRNLPFINLVDRMESEGGMDVSEILALSGQSGYRRLEGKALHSALNQYDSCCIETGGSIVSELKLLNFMLTACLVIWVRTTPELHMRRVLEQGDTRPMADIKDAMDDLRQILEERTPFYQKAHEILDTTDKSVEASYAELVEILDRHGSGDTTLLAAG